MATLGDGRRRHAQSYLARRDHHLCGAQRAVFAALILAGEPVNNRHLAELMDCSPGEASRRVAQLVQAELGSAKTAAIRKARKGREVLISLH